MATSSFLAGSFPFPDSSPKPLFRPRDENEGTSDTSTALSLLDTNGDFSGLRQRRRQQPPLVNTTSSSSTKTAAGFSSGVLPTDRSYNHGKLNPPLPPRTSYSLGTSAASLTPMKDSSNTPTALLSPLLLDAASSYYDPRQEGYQQRQYNDWVCIYGFNAELQPKILDLFTSFGPVIQQQSLGINAIALRYANPLQATKALCHTPFEVDGWMCGVTPYRGGEWNTPSEVRRQPPPSSLFAPSSAPHDDDDGNDAADRLFLVPPSYHTATAIRRPGSASESLCVRLVRWLLSVD